MMRKNTVSNRTIAELIIAIGLIAFLALEYIVPWVGVQVYGDEYKRLTYECDHAMHDEVATRRNEADARTAEMLRISGDVGLTVCHEYDKLRKRLLILGVSEDQLALLGLEVLEIEKIPVGRMVDPHRMERF